MTSQYVSRYVVLFEAFALAMSLTPRSSASQEPSLSFAPAVIYETDGFGPESVAIADLNRDGKADLVVAHCGNNPNCSGGPGLVGVLLGNGDGTFQRAVTYESGGNSALSAVVADVNGDGKPDLLVTNWCGGSDPSCADYGTVGVLLGRGDGTFKTAVVYDSGGVEPTSIVVADVNGDGKPDLVMANHTGNFSDPSGRGTVGVLLGKGNGTFEPAVTYATGGFYPESVAIADLNKDKKPDLLVTNWCADSACAGNGSVGVLLGNGDGTFKTAVTYDSGGFKNNSVAVDDVNGDGKPDLLLTNLFSSGNGVSVLLGKGDGTFRAAVTYNCGGVEPWALTTGDVNDDGKPDLLVTNLNSHNVGVLLGKGDGTFKAAVAFDSGGQFPRSARAADLNGDGKPDLLVANSCDSDDTNCTGFGNVGVLANISELRDKKPPVVTIAATPTSLWPPNGKLRPVFIWGMITDAGSGVNWSTASYSVIDEYGQVQPRGPIIPFFKEWYLATVWLQSSRNGNDKDGRKYTITVRAKDNAGNVGSASTVVTVSHDKGH
jgi:hypothetical protein